jgi:hypothetical protein
MYFNVKFFEKFSKLGTSLERLGRIPKHFWSQKDTKFCSCLFHHMAHYCLSSTPITLLNSITALTGNREMELVSSNLQPE